VVCSGEVGVAKPDEGIFRIALERLGLDPADVLFIDDTEEHVLAARSLGMNGHHFINATALIDHLYELGLDALSQRS
jgi:HAD superfamily hydrolase (TIGR01509 family)